MPLEFNFLFNFLFISCFWLEACIYSAIPPFRYSAIQLFRHSAIPLFRHSAIPPFRHSAIPPFCHSAIPLFLPAPADPRSTCYQCCLITTIYLFDTTSDLANVTACIPLSARAHEPMHSLLKPLCTPLLVIP